MEPEQALAILSFGAFLTVLVTLFFYVFTIRPRLLEPAVPSSPASIPPTLYTELSEQRAVVDRLNTALMHHTERLEAVANMPEAGEQLGSLQDMLRSQTDAVERLKALLDTHVVKLDGLGSQIAQQGAALSDLRSHVEELSTRPASSDSELLSRQNDLLVGLDSRLGSLSNAKSITQLAQQIERLDQRISERQQSEVDVTTQADLAALVQAQSDRLVTISARLDEWAAANETSHTQLTEHARALANLDRQVAAQAQIVQRLETKVGEHTTMLVTAASERREQANTLARVVDMLSQIGPYIRGVVAERQRPEQERLSDIKGIGPVYSGRLYEAGITTFRQLAAMTAAEIEAVIDNPTWRKVDAASWIEQAKLFASQREKVEELS